MLVDPKQYFWHSRKYNATKSCFTYLCVLREKADGNHHELVCHDSSRVLIDRPGRLNSNRFQQVRKTCFLLKRESVTWWHTNCAVTLQKKLLANRKWSKNVWPLHHLSMFYLPNSRLRVTFSMNPRQSQQRKYRHKRQKICFAQPFTINCVMLGTLHIWFRLSVQVVCVLC